MTKKTRYIIIIAIIAIFGGLTAWYKLTPGPYDRLAQCINNSGAKFYGAFWCPHCQEQKRVFSKSVKYLPYVECSTPDQKGQTTACTDQSIETYPTWIFPDGTRETGVKTTEYLAEKTACTIE
jgi:thiol-disulfide isomerase/thioredoxin